MVIVDLTSLYVISKHIYETFLSSLLCGPYYQSYQRKLDWSFIKAKEVAFDLAELAPDDLPDQFKKELISLAQYNLDSKVSVFLESGIQYDDNLKEIKPYLSCNSKMEVEFEAASKGKAEASFGPFVA